MTNTNTNITNNQADSTLSHPVKTERNVCLSQTHEKNEMVQKIWKHIYLFIHKTEKIFKIINEICKSKV